MRSVGILSALAIALAVGCAGKSMKDAASEPAMSNNLSVNITSDDKATLTGNTVFIESRDPYKSLTAENEAALVEIIRNSVTQWGFKIVDNRTQAYSFITWVSDTTPDDATKKTVYRMTLGWEIQEYGKRWNEKLRITFGSWVPWNQNFPALKTALNDELAKVKLAPPVQNKKMAGAPGCSPRFGFEEVWSQDLNNMVAKITKVWPNSPAMKSGLKIGDVLVAVDSFAYADWDAKNGRKIYEQRIQVPIKVRRNGEDVRTMIKPEIMCN